MEGFAALLTGLAQKGKHALDLVVLGICTPLDDDRTETVLAGAEGNAFRDWLMDFPETSEINPATGLLMVVDGFDTAGNPAGYAPDDDSSYLT
jgi:hypothetical protein